MATIQRDFSEFNTLGKPNVNRPPLIDPRIGPVGSNIAPPVAPQASPTSAMEAFIKSQRPNLLQAIGSGLSGFAAPFLGQAWNPPSDSSDMLEWILKEQMRATRNETPASLESDTIAALAEIKPDGSNRDSVFQKLAAKYPKNSAHLKRLIYPGKKEKLSDLDEMNQILKQTLGSDFELFEE